MGLAAEHWRSINFALATYLILSKTEVCLCNGIIGIDVRVDDVGRCLAGEENLGTPLKPLLVSRA